MVVPWVLCALLQLVAAQSPMPSVTETTGLTTVASTFLSPTITAGHTTFVNATSFATRTYTSTFTILPTTSPVPDLSSGAKLDPTYGVLGALLILTGLPSAFWGHKNRWSSFFLIGFYSLSLVCIALIFHFGVENAINPPSDTLRGLFLLSSSVAGFIGGGICIFFWNQAKYFVGAWGGFSLALWIQCFRDGGVVQPLGFRWILFIGTAVVGFVLCTIPKLHYKVQLASTAMVGASAFILGVDCFTSVGLKEFYVWNLGFQSLFPQYLDSGILFPVTQTMQIEIGLVAAVAIMGSAVQLRLNIVFMDKLKEIQAEQHQRDEEMEQKAARRFDTVDRDLDRWEKEHGNLRNNENQSPTLHSPEEEAALLELKPMDTVEHGIPPQFISATADVDLRKKAELLTEIQTIRRSIEVLKAGEEALREDALSSRPLRLSSNWSIQQDPVSPIVPRPPRGPAPRNLNSTTTRDRVRSLDIQAYLQGSSGPSQRIPSNSQPSSSLQRENGAAINRPVSAPLRDEEWDAYVRERKLFVPPAGVTTAIQPTAIPLTTEPTQQHRLSHSSLDRMSTSVAEALARRQRRESAYALGGVPAFVQEALAAPTGPLRNSGGVSEDDVPVALAAKQRHRKSNSFGSIIPNILPPQKATPVSAPVVSPLPTRTFEELQERHHEKLRAIQDPLMKVEVEQLELENAKKSWERKKQLEKEIMAKREAQKAAALFKESERRLVEKKEMENEARKSASSPIGAPGLPSSVAMTKRVSSTIKVQQWQKYQQEMEAEGFFTATSSSANAGERPSATRDRSAPQRRSSRTETSPGTVPFPGAAIRNSMAQNPPN